MYCQGGEKAARNGHWRRRSIGRSWKSSGSPEKFGSWGKSYSSVEILPGDIFWHQERMASQVCAVLCAVLFLVLIAVCVLLSAPAEMALYKCFITAPLGLLWHFDQDSKVPVLCCLSTITGTGKSDRLIGELRFKSGTTIDCFQVHYRLGAIEVH